MSNTYLTIRESTVLDKITNSIVKAFTPKDEREFEKRTLDALNTDDDMNIVELRTAVKSARKEMKNEEKDERELRRSYDRLRDKVDEAQYEEGMYFDGICYTMDRLDETLAKMENADSEAERKKEEKKAVHEIKRILKYAGKYDAAAEEDLEDLREQLAKH